MVAELKSLAKKSDHIYLATDLDREGEAIAWHLREVIGGDDSRFSRVVFNEITKKAIEKAFQHPAHINMDQVNARANPSFLRPRGILWCRHYYGKSGARLSAGRVQSVAVKLVVEREREIKAFQPEEFWEIEALTQTSKKERTCVWMWCNIKGKKFEPKNEKRSAKCGQFLK